jgi:hypothetical protein
VPIPPYVPSPCAHIRFIGEFNPSGPAGVGFWTPISAAVTSGELSTAAESLYTAFATTILADMSVNSYLTKCEVLAYVAPLELVGSYAAVSEGAATGATAAANVCAMVNWGIPSTWRGGKPRTYLWGVPGSAVSDDGRTLAGAYHTALQSEVVAFTAAANAVTVAGDPIQLSMLKKVTAGVVLSPGYLLELSSPEVNTQICSQRRRLRS